MKKLFPFVLLVSVCLFATGLRAEELDLKAFYLEQVELLKKEFVPPVPGATFVLKMVTGKSDSVTLYALDAASVTVVGSVGKRSYKRDTLAPETRALLFAEDYANAGARERTIARKKQAEADFAAANPDRAGYMIVKGDLDRDTEKEVEDKGSHGNYTKETKTQRETYSLDITVNNTAGQGDSFELFWYFIGHPVTADGDGDEVVIEAGKTTLSVPSRQRVKHEVTSGTLTLTRIEDEKFKSGDLETIVTVNGNEFDGYAVFMMRAGILFDKKASASKYLSEEWQAKGRQAL